MMNLQINRLAKNNDKTDTVQKDRRHELIDEY